MDKYDDLGLEASKFIEDLNMYEASRDGLFRVRRDGENNPDFEETRKVFASKMAKIHMQKQQEEMAKNSLAARINGNHAKVSENTKDRPPISNVSFKQGSEAAAKPPIMSGPMTGNASVNPYIPYEGQKHHPVSLHDGASTRAYVNSYDTKETGNAYNPIPVPARAASSTSPTGTWNAGNTSQTPSSPPASSSCSAGSPGVSLKPQSFAKSGKSLSQSPTGTYRAPGDTHHQHQQTSPGHCQPGTTQWSASGPTQNGVPHNTSMSTTPSSAQVTPPSLLSGAKQAETPQLKSIAYTPSSPVVSALDECSSPSRALKLPCQSLHVPTDQGPSVAEIKLEALTERLEKEMDVLPNAEYFGKHNVITASVFFYLFFHICNCI